jgi:hypothetical protein
MLQLLREAGVGAKPVTEVINSLYGAIESSERTTGRFYDLKRTKRGR